MPVAIRKEIDIAPPPLPKESGKVVSFYMEKQKARQYEMLAEALAKAPVAPDLTTLFILQTQAVSINPVKAKQAAQQEANGIFSTGYAKHFCFV